MTTAVETNFYIIPVIFETEKALLTAKTLFMLQNRTSKRNLHFFGGDYINTYKCYFVIYIYTHIYLYYIYIYIYFIHIYLYYIYAFS